MTAHTEKKMVKTYLDNLPWGDDAFVEAEHRKTRRERKRLPDGCRNSILYKDIMRIAWPSLVELLLASLASMVDMMMVGDMPVIGDDAIAAVNLATQPKFIFIALIIALNAGVTAAVARARGAADHDLANETLRQGIIVSLLVCIFGSVVGFVCSEPLVRFMANGGLSEEVIAMGVSYLQIQMAGFLTVGLTSTYTAALRGTGNSHVPMIYNVTANVVNVFGNYLLINGNLGCPALGVTGASIATVAGQVVAMIMAIWAVGNGKNYFHVRLRDFFHGFRVDTAIMSRIIKVGVPSLGEQAILRIGVILFTRQVTALGQPYYTTHQICMNIQSLTFMLGQAMAVSSTTLVGQSLGKRRPDMAEHYSSRCSQIGILISIVLGAFFALFGKYIVALYSETAAVIEASIPIMILLGVMQPIQTPQFILSGSLRGAGDTKSTAVITLICVLILRPVLATVTIPAFGLMGAWYAIAADQIVRTVLVTILYERGQWKKILL